jgi:hypothetical protein
MKPSRRKGTLRELESDVQKPVREALKNGCTLQIKGRSKHSKLALPNGVVLPIPANSKMFMRQLRKNGVLV